MLRKIDTGLYQYGTSEYRVQRLGNVWDAYLPAYDDDHRLRPWSSPGWRTKAQAESSIVMQIRRTNRAVREATRQ